MSSLDSNQESLSYEELLRQNQLLRQELDEMKAQEPFVWNLFAETSRKLQIYSASIKAAVSSLLNYDIFWDSANQHEFLETIDSSVNQVSESIVLLTLAFRAQANKLILRKDSHILQEILSISQVSAIKKKPDLLVEISFPSEGKPVLVDYEYLVKALVMLYEILSARSPAKPVQVLASESGGEWRLDFSGLDPSIIHIIEQMHHCKAQPSANELLSSESILKLHLVCEILHLQQISVVSIDEPVDSPILRLTIPEVTYP